MKITAGKLLERMRDLRFVCCPSELMDFGRFWEFL
jgi:hypothetical protein